MFDKNISFWCIVLFCVTAMIIHHILSDTNIIEGQENNDMVEDSNDMVEDSNDMVEDSNDLADGSQRSGGGAEEAPPAQAPPAQAPPAQAQAPPRAAKASKPDPGWGVVGLTIRGSREQLLGPLAGAEETVNLNEGPDSVTAQERRHEAEMLIAEKEMIETETQLVEAKAEAAAASAVAASVVAASASAVPASDPVAVPASDPVAVVPATPTPTPTAPVATPVATPIATPIATPTTTPTPSALVEGLLAGHSELGMCDSAINNNYYSENHEHYENAQGSCEIKRSCNFCCGMTVTGPDGNPKKYGPHCREGHCGAGSNPSKMVENKTDTKRSWTDCPLS